MIAHENLKCNAGFTQKHRPIHFSLLPNDSNASTHGGEDHVFDMHRIAKISLTNAAKRGPAG
jgi:hypothetical protein